MEREAYEACSDWSDTEDNTEHDPLWMPMIIGMAAVCWACVIAAVLWAVS